MVGQVVRSAVPSILSGGFQAYFWQVVTLHCLRKRAAHMALLPTTTTLPLQHSAAAVCLHGRAANRESVQSLITHLVAPLDADVFAVLIGDESTVAEWDTTAQMSNLTDSAHARAMLEESGRLVAAVSSSDPPVSRLLNDTSRGSWRSLMSATVRQRLYLDLSNRVQCAELVRTSRRVYSTLVHARMDLHLFEPLPVAVATRWRKTAEHERTVPHIFKPFGDDHMGVIDILAIANEAGMAAEVGVRDAITDGVVPYNTKLDAPRPKGHLDHPELVVFPEQLTAGQLIAKHARLHREEWAMCRIDSMSGACRYPGEVTRLLRHHMPLATANARIVCNATAAHHGALVDNQCCSARLLGGGLRGTQRSGRGGANFSGVTCQAYVSASGWKGFDMCGVDWHDSNCCALVQQCASLLLVRGA